MGDAIGILCALPEELGGLTGRQVGLRRHHGLELLELDLDGVSALACVGGVGKVLAARAATALVAEGAGRALLVVGVCGGLKRGLRAGDLVHCTRAVQADLAVRAQRESEPAERLLEAWSASSPGRRGWFLTADRPALSLWRRLRLARAYAGACVADMETAAAAAVADRSGVPWAALRAVTDGLWPGGTLAFPRHFSAQAGRAADTVPGLVRTLIGA
jgi:adenosylhomocysteine nucleosidase